MGLRGAGIIEVFEKFGHSFEETTEAEKAGLRKRRGMALLGEGNVFISGMYR